MAKVTPEYCRTRFLADFARDTTANQSAVIEALRTVRDTLATTKEAPLPIEVAAQESEEQ